MRQQAAEHHLERRCRCRLSLLTWILLTALCGQTQAADSKLYLEQIRPLLQERCYACHGALKQEAGLRLDTGQLIRQGSAEGPVVIPGDVAASGLLDRVTAAEDEGRMPPLGMPLSAEDVQHLREWIAGGAESPQFEEPEADPAEHWAFVAPQQPALPDVSDAAWCRTPIDRFLMQAWDRQGLQHADDVDPALLLRRVSLDLTGLQPAPEQLQKFLSDPSEEHYLQIVDQLLASPQYGERWGRHWMDVWRYSDWYGRRQQNDVRNSAPQIWRWRDWIVNSLNADHGYDRMVQEMLAADELAAADDSAWPATGYLIRSYYSLNPNEWMRHNVEYTGKAFLGLTFNCAHCHDHKYDPIEQDDYFRLRAFFEPMGIRQDRVVGEPEPPTFEPYTYAGSRKVVREGMVRIFDERPDAETWFYTMGDERNRQEDRGSIAPGVPRFLSEFFPQIEQQELPRESWYPGARAHLRDAVLREQQQLLADATQQLQSIAAETPVPQALQEKLAAAETQFAAALQELEASGQTAAISGKQSLLLEAGSGGRQLLQLDLNPLQHVPDNTQISFRLRLLQDGQMNFQLARDAKQLLTALFVEFSGGQIRSYQPSTFSPQTVGRYSIAEGETDFAVRLQVVPSEDVARLTVQVRERTLVDTVPVALNGWKPTLDPQQPIFLDCRESTRLLLDDLQIQAGETLLSWDFEPPLYPLERTVVGIAGWRSVNQTKAPSQTIVSRTAGDAALQPMVTALQAVQAEIRQQQLPRLIAEQQVAAATLQLQRLQAIWAADDARDLPELSSDQRDVVMRAAAAAERESALAAARLNLLQAEQAHAAALLLPEGTEKRDEQQQQTRDAQNVAMNAVQAAEQSRRDQAESIQYTSFSPLGVRQSTGRRAALARWITHRDNPLTARVAVNHIWMRHFGTPLVASVFNFGRSGKLPTHPQLLDWLAVELMQHDWSMKHLHRQIVSSRVYRMSSSAEADAESHSRDEDNEWLWRMPVQRMEAEQVRDNLLAVAGDLDLTRGGQPLLNTTAMTTNRRSLYYEVFPESGGNDPLAEVFDPPDPTECFRRTVTIMPQQALALSNSPLIHRVSGGLAGQIAAESDSDWIRQAFLKILVRQPTAAEQSLCEQYLQHEQAAGQDLQAARTALVRVLLNHNDFVTIR